MNNTENEKTVVAENSKSMKDDDLIENYKNLHKGVTIEINGNCTILSHEKYSKIKKEPGTTAKFVYDRSLNLITCLKHNKENGTIWESYKYTIKKVKNLKTFLDWIDIVNEDCKENNVCYDEIFEVLNECSPINIFDPKNPNLKLVRSENNTINFIKDDIVIDQFICDNINDSAKFIDYTENVFQFCEENNLPFEEYPSKISANMLKLQFGIYNILDEKRKEDKNIKILSKSFDKSGSTAFVYLSNGTVESCTYDDTERMCIGTIIKPFTEINNIEDFSNWIENNVKVFCNWSGFSYADYNAIIQNRPDVLYGVLQKITNKKTLQNITDATKEVEKLNHKSRELKQ